jgi:hypothetical protein
MPIFTICVRQRAIVTVSVDSRSYLLERLEHHERDDLRIYLTTWSVRGKPVWNGDMRHLVIRLATAAEAAKFQQNMLDWAREHPDDEDPDDDAVWRIIAPIDDASHEAASRRIREKFPAGMTLNDEGDLVPLQ